MEKVFMDRAVMPEETVEKARYYMEKVLGIEYDLDIWNTPDEQFWVSKIQLKGFGKAYPSHATSMGKGLSKSECLASNYGEFFEKLAWEIWMNDVKDFNGKLKVKNLINNKMEDLSIDQVRNYFWDAAFSASGNNIEEARYHSLLDVIELGWGGDRNAFLLSPIENTILKTEKAFPYIDKKYHDNTAALVQRDLRIPSVYYVTTFKAPNENDPPFMIPPVEVNDGNIEFHFNEIPLEAKPMLSNTTDPWPPFLGRRLGLNLEKIVPLAMGEIMQVYYFYDQDSATGNLPFYFPEGDKRNRNYFKEYEIENYQNFETSTIEEDNQVIINDLANAGFNVWELDISLPESPIKTVKLFSDYTLGRLTHIHEQTLNKFFYFEGGKIDRTSKFTHRDD